MKTPKTNSIILKVQINQNGAWLNQHGCALVIQRTRGVLLKFNAHELETRGMLLNFIAHGYEAQGVFLTCVYTQQLSKLVKIDTDRNFTNTGRAFSK